MADLYRYVGIPGAGKTQQLRRQVEAWVDRDGISPADIVLTSFTRTAATVLRGRVPVPSQNAATLHSLGFRAIGHCMVADGNKDLIKQWNESNIPLAWQMLRKHRNIEDDAMAEEDPENDFLARYGLWRALGRQGPLAPALEPFVKRWEDFKQQTGSIDFTDMIDYALRDADSCPGDPDCFVVDEAQDLNPIQWALVKKWGAAAHHRFVVAGDPAQCLYSWIGSSPNELLEELPEGHHHLLGHSYRNPRRVQAEAEGWLRYHSGSMMVGRDATPDDREGGVYHLPINHTDPDALVSEALRHMEAGETTAILAPCSYSLTEVIARMREFGVPFHNPYRPMDGKWNPLRRLTEDGENTGSVQRLRCFLESEGGPRAVTALEQLPAVWFSGTRKAAMEGIMAGELPETFLKERAAEAWRGSDGAWYALNMPEKSRKPLALAWNIYKRDPELLRSEPKVIVGTIHSIKGGEADHVYLFPDIPKRVVDEAEESPEQRDAIVRQWYVGMTRARQTLTYCEPQWYGSSVEAVV